MAEKLLRLEITAAEEDYEALTGLLWCRLSSGWEEQSLATGETLFRVHCENAGLVDEIAQAVAAHFPGAVCRRDTVVVEDWVTAWKDFFTPVPCGSRFVVLPPWLAGQGSWPGRIEIVIEPKSAFGTGHHATTALCLTALSNLLDQGVITKGQTFLDLGTGSGVLGMGLALSGLHGEGYDIDPLATDNATENRDLNHIAAADFVLGLGSIDAVQGRSFDLVVANILAQPLIDMAPDILAARKGVLVLSGILSVQAPRVKEAYAALGTPEELVEGEWSCLVWR